MDKGTRLLHHTVQPNTGYLIGIYEGFAWSWKRGADYSGSEGGVMDRGDGFLGWHLLTPFPTVGDNVNLYTDGVVCDYEVTGVQEKNMPISPDVWYESLITVARRSVLYPTNSDRVQSNIMESFWQDER